MKRISALIAVLCVCFTPVAWGQKNGWREFHRPDMQRYNPYEKTLNVHNVGSLQLKWSYNMGAQSSPAVAKGVVYFGAYYYGNVYALNASTGAKLWGHRIAAPYSSPAVANGVVYVGGDNGDVYALNARTGAKVWSYTTGLIVES